MRHSRRICHAHCPHGGARFTAVVLAVVTVALVMIAYPVLHVALALVADAALALGALVTLTAAGLFTWGMFSVAAAVRRAGRTALPGPARSRPAVRHRPGGWQIAATPRAELPGWSPYPGQVVEAEVVPGHDGVAP